MAPVGVSSVHCSSHYTNGPVGDGLTAVYSLPTPVAVSNAFMAAQSVALQSLATRVLSFELGASRTFTVVGLETAFVPAVGNISSAPTKASWVREVM